MDALQVAQLQAREAVDALVSAETLSKADLSQGKYLCFMFKLH